MAAETRRRWPYEASSATESAATGTQDRVTERDTMSAFATPIDPTKLATTVVVTNPARIATDLASAYATINAAGHDVAAVEIFRTDDPGGRNDLLTAVVITKSRV